MLADTRVVQVITSRRGLQGPAAPCTWAGRSSRHLFWRRLLQPLVLPPLPKHVSCRPSRAATCQQHSSRGRAAGATARAGYSPPGLCAGPAAAGCCPAGSGPSCWRQGGQARGLQGWQGVASFAAVHIRHAAGGFGVLRHRLSCAAGCCCEADMCSTASTAGWREC